MRPIYIWQYPAWPNFTWDAANLLSLLSEVRNHEGRIQGMMNGLGFDVRYRTSLDVMTEDVLRSCVGWKPWDYPIRITIRMGWCR